MTRLLRNYCGHGKPLTEQCLACAMMWRIEQRKDAELARLRARVAELEAKLQCC